MRKRRRDVQTIDLNFSFQLAISDFTSLPPTHWPGLNLFRFLPVFPPNAWPQATYIIIFRPAAAECRPVATMSITYYTLILRPSAAAARCPATIDRFVGARAHAMEAGARGDGLFSPGRRPAT